MSRSWYIQHHGRARGPVTSVQLRRLAEDAKITPRTRVRADDSDEWINASQLRGLFSFTQSAVSIDESPYPRNTQSERSSKRKQSPVSLIHSVLVRLLALAVPLGSVAWQVYLYTHFADQINRGRQPVSWYVSFFGLVVFALPCCVICYKGPITGKAASRNRRKGFLQIIFGIGAIGAGVVVNLVINLLGGGYFAFLWFGVFGVAMISIVLGFLGLVSGRDLFEDMGEKTKEKKR